MRALVQRVTSASVRCREEVLGRIDPGPGRHGLLVLVGVTHSDTERSAEFLARKVWTMRILENEKAAADLDAPILLISQFTLYGDTVKGRRPSWTAAAPRPVAEPLVDAVVTELRELGATVATGSFGEHMHVESVNDGPISLLVEV